MPDTLVALAIAVLFFLPGYIAALAFIRNAPYAEPKDLRFLLQVAFWAAVVHAVAYPLTAPLIGAWREDPFLSMETWRFLGWFIGVVLVGPAVLGMLVGQVARTPKAQAFLARVGMSVAERSPTAWDVAFGPGRPGAWVRVRVKEVSGSVWVAGKLGPNSAVGVSPHAHDLFLEEVWELDADGLFTRKRPGTAGVWIAADRIDYVELYRS